jgi:CheY-like chemotaxis protein/HPt (histidine-containing phosphotransfer) domain-containing protein
MVIGDPARLRQVIVNLVGNAVKFTKAGEVLTSCEILEQNTDSAILHFSVKDSGIGIPKDRLESIFESFSQVDGSTTRKYGGTGLGLAICRQLTNIMGGDIWAESQIDRGSTFHFTVRFRLDPTLKPPAHEQHLEDLGGLRALVVDDYTTNRAVLKEMISSWGIACSEAGDGTSAMEEIESAKTPYDLVVIDMQMPGMNGLELNQWIREHPGCSVTKTILLPSVAQARERFREQDLGISGYAIKPVRKSELFEAIMGALGRGGPIHAPEPSTCEERAETTERSLQILLAEDHVVNQKLVTRLLEKRGHSVILAENGQKALDIVDAQHVDLIFMDVQMPVMDGLEATMKIREREANSGTHTPIVAMTAYAMKRDRQKCLDAGMDGHVSKPIRSREIEEILQAACEDRVIQYFSAIEDREPTSPPPQFELENVLDHFDGDTELIAEAFDLLESTYPDDIAAMRRAIRSADFKGLHRTAHRFKGGLANFHMDHLTNLAAALERMGDEERLDGALETLSTLETFLGEFIDALRERLSKVGSRAE